MASPSDANAPISETTPLRIAGSWLQALTEGSQEIVALFDADGALQYLSESGAVRTIVGYEALELAHLPSNELLHPLDVERVVEAFRTVAAHPGGRLALEYRVRHRSGHFVHVHSTAINRLENRYVSAIVVHTRELPVQPPVATVRSPAAAQPTFEDERGLLGALDQALERAAHGRYGFSVLVIDLARRKRLALDHGERFVHTAQTQLGTRLHALLRPGDTLAHLKPGPYAIMLDAVGERPLAERVASRIQRTVGTRFGREGSEVPATVVVGIVTSERRYERGADMLRDASLAAAKAHGEGGATRAVYRTEMQLERTRHMTLLAELHNALQRGQLRVYYLPIVALATRTLSGFEALVRWQHPVRGLISPDLFIPIAEDTGLIVQLGRWVLLSACRQMADWSARYPMDPPLWVSVNLSREQLADPAFCAQLADILKDTALPPAQLALDIPERALATQRDMVAPVLRRAAELGVTLVADSFGAGEGSVTSLHDQPYRRLEIDRQLISAVGEPKSRDLVRAITSLAHELSLEVVAEGVETPGQAAQVSRIGCEYAKGYLFGKPATADATGALIASYPKWWS